MNWRPPGYEPGALTKLSYGPHTFIFKDSLIKLYLGDFVKLFSEATRKTEDLQDAILSYVLYQIFGASARDFKIVYIVDRTTKRVRKMVE